MHATNATLDSKKWNNSVIIYLLTVYAAQLFKASLGFGALGIQVCMPKIVLTLFCQGLTRIISKEKPPHWVLYKFTTNQDPECTGTSCKKHSQSHKGS